MAFISHINYADTFGITSSQTFFSGFPLANLLDRRLAKVARRDSAGVSGIQVRVDLGAINTPPVRIMAGLNGNRAEQSWWDNALGGCNITWGADSTGFTYAGNQSQGDIDLFDRGVGGMMTNAIHVLPAAITARYWQILFTFVPLTALNYAQMGRFWLGNILEFVDVQTQAGVDAPWGMAHVDPSIVRRSRGQQVYTDEKLRYRTLDFTVDNISKDWAYGKQGSPYHNKSFQEVFLSAGQSREVIVCPRVQATGTDSEKLQFLNRTSIYGTLVGEGKITHKKADRYSMSFKVQEAR